MHKRATVKLLLYITIQSITICAKQVNCLTLLVNSKNINDDRETNECLTLETLFKRLRISIDIDACQFCGHEVRDFI